MEKEVKIVPPEGYEVDKENSTFDCIKFKPIVEKWRDKNPVIKGYFLGGCFPVPFDCNAQWKPGNLNVFATEKQAKSALAMAQISQIMANDKRFGGVVTDKEWRDGDMIKYTIIRSCTTHFGPIQKSCACNNYCFLAFHTATQSDLFLEENEDLVRDYLMID